jgi:hypothetical protein
VSLLANKNLSYFLELKHETILRARLGFRLRMFDNRVLRRIFGLKRDEETGGCRKLHNEDLHNLYSSPSIIRMIKSGRMTWAGCSTKGRSGMHIGYWCESHKERGRCEDQDVGGWTISKWILER